MVQILQPPYKFKPQPFKVVEAMGSKVVAVTSHAMASPPYKISSKSINQIKSH
jgi:hypothetical protein